MKAVVYKRYGPPEVLQLTDIPRPAPGDNEVLIRVHATTVTIGDVRMRSFTVPRAQWLFARLYLGILRPRRPILGMELAGEIEAIGKAVTRFKMGDPIFASTFEANFGGYAEYKCMPEDGLLAFKPANLTFAEAAAAVGGGISALRCLQRGKLQAGQKILIYGASGSIGTNAVQLAKNHFGAEVTGVCSTANLELVKALGAVEVIDYTREDFTQRGTTYDVVFDAVAKFPPARAKQALNPTGIYLNAHRDTDAGAGLTMKQELLLLKKLLEAENLKPVIDRSYPLAQIVAAHRYVDTGHKRGNVVITVAHTGATWWQGQESAMSTSILVGYASRSGSTQEVAEAIAATLRERGIAAACHPLREIRSLDDGYTAVVIGAPLYMFRWHKDAKHFLARHRQALQALPVAVFALGPLHDDPQEWQDSRGHLDKELQKFPWLAPVAVGVFGGKFDPTKLRFPYNLIPALKRMPASDIRDWEAIRNWANDVATKA